MSLSIPIPAQAGSYTGPVYTGGTSTEPPSSGHPSIPYAPGSSGIYGGYGGDSGGVGSFSCTGTITTTFTWHPDPGQTLLTDPPPSTVILQETCMATAIGNSIPAATVGGSCDNGLGATQASLTQTVIPYGFPPVIYSTYGTGFVNSTRYQTIPGTTIPGGAAITLTRNPTAGATCLQGASASLRYTAAIYPVIITITGTTPVGGSQALTGQQLTATLNVPGGCALYQPPGQTGYQWTITGSLVNKVFKNYDYKLPSNQLTLLTATDLTAASPSFYDSAAETVNATCAVTLVAPDGITKFPVTAISKNISVLKPTTTWNIDTGYVQPAAIAGFFALLPAPGTGFPGGEYWHNAAISVPTPFAGGEGCFAQIITPDFEMFQDGSNLPHADPNNKVQGLDNQFPYVNYQWTLPAVGTQSDTPAIGVSGVNVPQYQGWNTATHSDSFITWLMYRPPVVGSQSHVWVALQTYGWNWSATVQWINNQWTITASNPSSTARAPARQITTTNDPPTWLFTQTNGP